MAKIERGSFGTVGTGNTTVLFSDNTLLADEITFSIGPAGGSDTDCHHCIGFTTPSQQTACAIFADATAGEKTEQVNSKCILHYAKVGGVVTKVLEGTRNSMATAGEFTINLTTWTTGYTIYFIARQY